MTDEQQQDQQQDEELILTDEVEGDEADTDQDVEQGGDEHPPADEPDEFAIEIEIDGDEPDDEETPLIKQLREQLRDSQREKAELKKLVAPAKIEVGKKPDLWDDCDGDPEKFEAELLAWQDRKDKAARQEQEAQQAEEVKNREYQRRFVNYRAKAAALPVQDFDDAEKTVINTLPELLQSAIVGYAEDPAKVVYALAKHPAKLTKLAEESDPIKFVLAMRDMERSLKVINRKRPPAPEAETIQSGSAQAAGSADKQLEKLEKEAARTGDRSKLVAYKAQKRAA